MVKSKVSETNEYPQLMKGPASGCIVLMDSPTSGMIVSGRSNHGRGVGEYGRNWMPMLPFKGDVVLSS